MQILCDYCGQPAQQVTGKVIYSHRPDLYAKTFYSCQPCRAYVGCHPGTDKPLGRLANAELRSAKEAAHVAFDPLWKTGKLTRSAAYSWLAQALGMEKHKCHIGMFNVETCVRVCKLCAAKRKEENI